jgi:methionyl-tRNA formyltransferase
MKILCIGYRDWALRIYDKLIENYHNGEIIIIKSHAEYSDSFVKDYSPDFILFYGWSWIISKEIVNNYKCITLHPSKLPKYRGGSPLQNQIIRGETNSAVTLFLMNNDVDSGPILFQESISLAGSISDIFDRIEKIGYKGTMQFLNNPIGGVEQKHDEATYFKRRIKEQSEITFEELREKSSIYIYNKIRMLEDPYPNAYIKTKDGKKIVLKSVEIEDC